MVCGFVFGKIQKRIEDYVMVVGFLALSIGLFGISISKDIIILALFCFICGGSIGFVMPNCMYKSAYYSSSESVTMATAIVFSASNLGTFLAPILSEISNKVLGISGIDSTLKFVSCMALLGTCIIYMTIKKHKTEDIQEVF